MRWIKNEWHLFWRARRGAKMWCLLPAGLPGSGKLPVLFLLRGQKSDFSPRRGDSLHRFSSNWAGPTGTGVRLAVQNFTSIGTARWECGPKNIKNFSLDRFRKFLVFFYTTNYPTLVFQISCDSHYTLRSYCWETAHR